jgi:hypothetical protein
VWNYTSAPPYIFMVWYWIKHRDSFTFLLVMSSMFGTTHCPICHIHMAAHHMVCNSNRGCLSSDCGKYDIFLLTLCASSLQILYLLPSLSHFSDNVPYVATNIRWGIGFTTGFIGSLTVTHNYSVYTSQLTIAAATFLWRLLLSPNTHS